MRLLFLLFPICRRATDIGMETRTYRRDPRKGFGPGDRPDEPHEPEQMYEGLQFRVASVALLLLSHRIRFK
jgi:hypothetical protein